MTAPLREGFTTGSAAAAAAKAGVYCLAGRPVPAQVDIPLLRPEGTRLTVAVAGCDLLAEGVRVRVVKDAGDDPDVTHGATIACRLRSTDQPGLTLLGGPGVGRVTLPGLPVAVGQPAINPGPRRQIALAVAEAQADTGLTSGLEVTVEVEHGEALARRTLNPRLGIVGGISILGTRGTVKPFSHEAYVATIAQGLAVARATGARRVALTTGGRSEHFLRQLLPHLAETACVQAADHFAAAMAEAGRLGFSGVLWGVFFGKLLKQAQGLASTHAKDSRLDLAPLVGLCRELGLEPGLCARIGACVTAKAAADLLAATPVFPRVLGRLAGQAATHGQRFAGQPLAVVHYVFDFDGRLLHGPQEAEP